MPFIHQSVSQQCAVDNRNAPTISATAPNTQAMYDYAKAHLNDNPMPVDFGTTQLPGIGVDEKSAASAAAGLALYEEAGASTDNDLANKLIKFGNNLLAYREQAKAVQPAFDSQLPTFELMTPTVNLRMKTVTWSFNDYCKTNGIDILSKNWGLFDDRWVPIVAAFQLGYDNYPASIWPMPPSDPAQ